MWLSVARRTQRNEVQFGIVSPATAEMLVMDSRLGHRTGQLAMPTIRGTWKNNRIDRS